ncbi:hypothetical protein [Streptomyces griseus]|uniref:hypothetical protein n=1 Tax=Streptomyces griseus TaxID=1911 RepID=UPI00131BB551|nr:hypothetical protein [Streptomyces griseus]
MRTDRPPRLGRQLGGLGRPALGRRTSGRVRTLAKASKILTEELDLVEEAGTDPDVGALWAAVEEAVPRTAVASAVATVAVLVPDIAAGD